MTPCGGLGAGLRSGPDAASDWESVLGRRRSTSDDLHDTQLRSADWWGREPGCTSSLRLLMPVSLSLSLPVSYSPYYGHLIVLVVSAHPLVHCSTASDSCPSVLPTPS